MFNASIKHPTSQRIRKTWKNFPWPWWFRLFNPDIKYASYCRYLVQSFRFQVLSACHRVASIMLTGLAGACDGLSFSNEIRNPFLIESSMSLLKLTKPAFSPNSVPKSSKFGLNKKRSVDKREDGCTNDIRWLFFVNVALHRHYLRAEKNHHLSKTLFAGVRMIKPSLLFGAWWLDSRLSKNKKWFASIRTSIWAIILGDSPVTLSENAFDVRKPTALARASANAFAGSFARGASCHFALCR